MMVYAAVSLFGMRVEFVKLDDKGRRACRSDALRSKRRRVPGTTMAVRTDIPHDLAQYVIEASTCKSTGRRRTKPGRAVIAEHRSDLAWSEQLAGLHLHLWKAGHPGPVTTALDRAFTQWQALQAEDRLVFNWPSAEGRISQ